MVEDEQVQSLPLGGRASVFESRLPYLFYVFIFLCLKYKYSCGAMAEWLMRGTVNTFFRGSIPLGTYYSVIIKKKN
jgi:hypothetical protein